MNPALQPFLTVALPIMITLIAAMWTNNSRLNDMSSRLSDFRDSANRDSTNLRDTMNRGFAEVNRRIDQLDVRMERIECKLDNHEDRLIRLEERTSPLHR